MSVHSIQAHQLFCQGGSTRMQMLSSVSEMVWLPLAMVTRSV